MPVKDLTVISNNLLRIVSRAQATTYYIPRTAIIGITVSDHLILNTKQGDFKLYTETQHDADKCVSELSEFLSGKKQVRPVRWDMPSPDAMALEELM